MARKKIVDRATDYAKAVVAGEIIAGPYVRGACRRHLDDLKRGAERGLSWDVEAADRIIRFFEQVLTVEIEDDDGESLAAPFIVEGWEAFILGSLFGWKNERGLRRFRRAYVEVAKGNGKSPIAAGIGHYMLTATDKLRGEVYSAATDADQAAILFRDAVAMYERSPRLRQRLHPSGKYPVYQLTHRASGGFFRPISSEKKGKSGIRPYCALVDEIHEHADNSVIEMLRAGTKGNQQALVFEITNSGFDRHSVCYYEHDYSTKIATGALENDAWFSYVCALDEDDDPFKDDACWIKANPNLGVSIRIEYIREQVREARGMPSKESLVRRLNFCEWVEAGEQWLTRAAWEAVEDGTLELEFYEGRECWLGLDMSFVKDLTALGIVFASEARGVDWDLFIEYWSPKETLIERAQIDRVPYDRWVEDGHIHATRGKVVRLEQVAERLAALEGTYDVRGLAYDRYRHRELDVELIDLGIEISTIEHPQGFRRTSAVIRDRSGDPVMGPDGEEQKNPLWMPSSFEAFENAVIEARIRVAVNPVTRWCVSSAVVRDDPSGTGNRVFDKKKSTGRIDGAVAGAMAIGFAEANPQLTEGPSVYETAGFFI